MSNNRVKLDTKIEMEVHRLVNSISEKTYDRLQLIARKQQLPVEPHVLDQLLKTMQVIISEIEMNNIDTFHANIKSELDAYVGEENPTEQVRVGGDPGSSTTLTARRPKAVAITVA
jgi:hypothetical protein